MSEFQFFNFRAKVDRRATSDWYTKAEDWDCTCGHCRNFLTLARDRRLPAPVLNLLDELEIPPEKAIYVCELFPDDIGHCYQFSYRIAGQLLTHATSMASLDWGKVGCYYETYPFGAPDFPPPHFDLEFWVSLPWVLAEPDQYR